MQPLTALFPWLGIDVAEALGSNAAQAMGFQLFAPVADNVSLGLPGASGETADYALPAQSICDSSVHASKPCGVYPRCGHSTRQPLYVYVCWATCIVVLLAY